MPGSEIDVWREDVYALLSGMAEPLAVLMLLAAFSLGLFSVRAIA